MMYAPHIPAAQPAPGVPFIPAAPVVSNQAAFNMQMQTVPPNTASSAASSILPHTEVNLQGNQKMPVVQDPANLRGYLNSNGWPTAMQEYFISSLERIPIRYFICDDSGSMCTEDGNRIISYNGTKKMGPCSRWVELTDTLKFHVHLAAAGKVACEFRLLNNAPPIKIGFNQYSDELKVNELMRAFEISPSNSTPLCKHIREVTAEIQQIAPLLIAAHQIVSVIIATDGVPTDGNIVEALRPLKSLPVMIILRFCTNEDDVIEYWHNVEKEIELNLDSLDDLAGEAKEIHKVNPWLTYGEPLHKMREFGISTKEIDFLDESLLSLENFKKICKLLYGDQVSRLPPPEIEGRGFFQGLANIGSNTMTWCPVKQIMKSWIDISVAKRFYLKNSQVCDIM